jgi:TetR/AcrR family transcriptional repressor of lmrAB and yxaGH operons
MAPDTRARMIDAATEALRRDGVAGMSFTEVLEASGAARGAIYHHFPGGKKQLVTEAAQRDAEFVRDGFASLEGATPADVVQAFLKTVRPVVQRSTTGSSCAVAAVALAADDDEELRATAARGFTSWTSALAERLTIAGMAKKQAADLGTTLLALLEGAHVLCRAERSIEPFDRAARTALLLVEPRAKTRRAAPR